MNEDRNHNGPAPTPVRCAVYIRVNVGAARDADLVRRQQRDAAQAFLQGHAHRGWTCVATYEDIGYSAGTLERPGLKSLLADINAGRLDCVLVNTLDRLVRMHEDYEMLVTLLRRCDVKLVTLYPEPLVVAYYRDSTHARQESSIPLQQDKVRQWCENHGVDIACEFADRGDSTPGSGPSPT